MRHGSNTDLFSTHKPAPLYTEAEMKLSSSILVAASVLAPSSLAAYTNESEVPYYGLSPPVYPTRKLWPYTARKHLTRL